MPFESAPCSPEGDGPKNPIRDILIFERRIKRSYAEEARRRIMYFVVLTTAVVAYILYVSKQIFEAGGKAHVQGGEGISVFVLRLYVRMLGTSILIFYVFIRLLRRSSKLTSSLSAQLKLLNLSLVNQKLVLCQIKTPENIRKAVRLFRSEEERRRAQWHAQRYRA